MTYLDVAARAPLPARVQRAIVEHLGVCAAEGALKPAWFSQVEETRAATAGLIGAAPREVAFMKNTSDGINTLAAALDLEPGDNVVVCPEFEHANNLYPWLHQRGRGVEVRSVPLSEGLIDTDAVAANVDARTRVVTVSSVASMSGGRADLSSLAELCRPRDVFLLVDAAQSLGILRTDVHELGVDALVCGAQKGLLSTYGLGVLYCREAWLERLRPPFMSVSSVSRAGVHESDLGDLIDFRPHASAAKFETGGPNFTGIFALRSALTIFEEFGPANIEERVVNLAADLMQRLTRDGVRVVTPRGAHQHAGIVVFELPDVADVADVVERLERAGIRVSLRRGRVRASLHAFNDSSDLDHLVSELRSVT